MDLGSRQYQQLQSTFISDQRYSIIPPLFHISQSHCSLKSKLIQLHHAPFGSTISPEILVILRLVVWPKTVCKNILEEFKFGNGAPSVYYVIIGIVQLLLQHVKVGGA